MTVAERLQHAIFSHRMAKQGMPSEDCADRALWERMEQILREARHG